MSQAESPRPASPAMPARPTTPAAPFAPSASRWAVVDLFSGAGGMSYGFHAHPDFQVTGAVDAQLGKPSTGPGALGCNVSYRANLGLLPVEADLATSGPAEVCAALGLGAGEVTVLAACPPCTGFTRTMARNHLRDDQRNSLVRRVSQFVEILRPDIVLMENARELVMGRFSGHLSGLLADLSDLGYTASASTHVLDRFGLPQRRERALVVAARRSLPRHDLADLWAGWRVSPKATHVRRAIWELPAVRAGAADPDDDLHVSPALSAPANRSRLAAMPHDGGSWADLMGRSDGGSLLTPAMRRRVAAGDLGSYPDVYGRLWWDRPAVTIKRECGHIGNGRYAHPEQDRLCTVREMSILQGFPRDYRFAGSLSNMYRHIGDAVPPLISYQLAAACRWMLTGRRPEPAELILPGCHLTESDVEAIGGG
ncbi:MAG TPA: DNA cytosine methyltransferase [Streptosporangiaceae bacterium]|nr:DNA cytosine methyltransferase [Streptosporangiaceae bacterium]